MKGGHLEGPNPSTCARPGRRRSRFARRASTRRTRTARAARFRRRLREPRAGTARPRSDRGRARISRRRDPSCAGTRPGARAPEPFLARGILKRMPASEVPRHGGPLDATAVAQIVASSDCGAIATFVGIVRDQHRGTACSGSTTKRTSRWRSRRSRGSTKKPASAGRRSRSRFITGSDGVEIGEASVVIAAASPHRAGSVRGLPICDRTHQQIAPIWKHEHFEGGDVWIEGATADPMDDEVRRMAFAQCS